MRDLGAIESEARMPGAKIQPSILEPVSSLASAETQNLRLRAQASQQGIPVPLLDFNRQYKPIREEVLAAIERVCDSQQFILGPEVEALESDVASLTGAKTAVGCASGTDALWLVLAGAGVKPGDRVITTPFSFFASASSIVRAGAEPVFADVDPATLNLDPENIVATLRSLRKARHRRRNDRSGKITGILPVHLYGQCADMTALLEIAREHDIELIEDAAQAIGAKWRGRGAGSIGKTAAFSFYPTKNLSAFGEAGIATTNNKQTAQRMRRLRTHGSPRRYLHTEFGWNARLDAIQAAVLRVKLRYIRRWNEQRRERAKTYDRLLADAGFAGVMQRGVKLSRRDPVRRLSTRPEAEHVFHQYVIRAWRRDELRKFLAARNIGSEVYYPIPLHLQPVFAYLGYKRGDLPESERAAREVLALPIFPELTEAEQKSVVQAIAEFYS